MNELPIRAHTTIKKGMKVVGYDDSEELRFTGTIYYISEDRRRIDVLRDDGECGAGVDETWKCIYLEDEDRFGGNGQEGELFYIKDIPQIVESWKDKLKGANLKKSKKR